MPGLPHDHHLVILSEVKNGPRASVLLLVFVCFNALSCSRDPTEPANHDEFESDLLSALNTVGPKSESSQKHLKHIQGEIAGSYEAMPKNQHGRLGPRAVRHLMRQFMVRTSGLFVNGLEDHGFGRRGGTALHEVGIVKHSAPHIKRALLEARPLELGLSLQEVASYISALENLIDYELVPLLDLAYKLNNRSANTNLNESEALEVLETYHILFAKGTHGGTMPSLDFSEHKELIEFRRRSSDFRQTQELIIHAVYTVQNQLQGRINFLAAHPFSREIVDQVAGQLRKEYGSWQNSECRAMKLALVKLDYNGDGRVSIKDFYQHPGNSSKFAFTESVRYLRKSGMLDETLPGNMQVLIPNYISGPANCVAHWRHFAYCCISECMNLFNSIEREVLAPTATPKAILGVVRSLMHNQTIALQRLSSQMVQQLRSISVHHGGKVHLHGRLFSQWLHYAFPQECPYPHIVEVLSALQPGADPRYQSTTKERDVQIHTNRTSNASVQRNQFFQLWNDEEVLPLQDSDAASPSSFFCAVDVQNVIQILLVIGSLRIAFKSLPIPFSRSASKNVCSYDEGADDQPTCKRSGAKQQKRIQQVGRSKDGRCAKQSPKDRKSKEAAHEESRQGQKAKTAKVQASVKSAKVGKSMSSELIKDCMNQAEEKHGQHAGPNSAHGAQCKQLTKDGRSESKERLMEASKDIDEHGTCTASLTAPGTAVCGASGLSQAKLEIGDITPIPSEKDGTDLDSRPEGKEVFVANEASTDIVEHEPGIVRHLASGDESCSTHNSSQAKLAIGDTALCPSGDDGTKVDGTSDSKEILVTQEAFKDSVEHDICGAHKSSQAASKAGDSSSILSEKDAAELDSSSVDFQHCVRAEVAFSSEVDDRTTIDAQMEEVELESNFSHTSAPQHTSLDDVFGNPASNSQSIESRMRSSSDPSVQSTPVIHDMLEWTKPAPRKERNTDESPQARSSTFFQPGAPPGLEPVQPMHYNFHHEMQFMRLAAQVQGLEEQLLREREARARLEAIILGKESFSL